MANRLFWTQVNRAFDEDGEPESGARTYFFENETSTQLTIYADSGLDTEMAQPVVADGDGVFPTVYVDSPDAVRVLMQDSTGTALPGYPMDDIYPFSDTTSAAAIAFSPTADIQATTVQSAIEAAGALSTDQTSVIQRALTPWVTGGTSNAYTLTPSPAITGYGSWQAFIVRPDRANTGAATLNVNGFGARNWQRLLTTSGTPTALVATDIVPYIDIMVVYDGTRFLSSVDKGRNFGGTDFVRTPDGVQIAWATNLTFLYSSATVMNCTWTYPATFAATPAISITLPGTAAGTYTGVAVADVGAPRYADGTTSSVLVFNKDIGGTNFPVGASITNVRAMAIGRWF